MGGDIEGQAISYEVRHADQDTMLESQTLLKGMEALNECGGVENKG